MKVARLCVKICWELTGKKNFRGRHKSGKCLCCHWINKIVRITDTLGERGFQLARERAWTKHITPGMYIWNSGFKWLCVSLTMLLWWKRKKLADGERERKSERNRYDKIHCFLRTLHNINLIWMCYVCSGYAEVSGESDEDFSEWISSARRASLSSLSTRDDNDESSSSSTTTTRWMNEKYGEILKIFHEGRRMVSVFFYPFRNINSLCKFQWREISLVFVHIATTRKSGEFVIQRTLSCDKWFIRSLSRYP